MGFLEDALGDAGGNAIPVGKLLNFAVGGQGANPIQGGFNIQGILGSADQIFGQIGDDLGGLKDALEDALLSVIRAITDPSSDALEDIYKGFVTLIAEAFAKAFKAIVDALKGAIEGFNDGAINEIAQAVKGFIEALGNAISKISNDVWRELSNAWKIIVVAFRKFVDEFFKLLSSAFEQFNNLPGPLKCGSIFSIGAIGAMVKLLVHFDADIQVNFEARVEAVNKSLGALFQLLIGSTTAEGRFLFGVFFDRLNDLMLDLIRGTFLADPGRLWTDFVLRDLIFSKDLFLGLIDSIANNKIWAWFELPCALGPGQLHGWLNDAATFDGNIALQRDFRVRLVAALDSFLSARGSLSLPTLLTDIDKTDTPYVVAGLISTILDTTLNFVFEPDCFAFFEADLDGIEDLGGRLSITFSRQIRASIRATISGLLRGISFWSIRNEVLIELIGSVLGSLLAGTIEAAIRNLTWSFRVVTAYNHTEVGGELVVKSWQSIEVVAGTDQHLEFLLLVRAPRQGQTVPDIDWNQLGPVLGIFMDLGAYIDLSYRRFRFENRFPAISSTDEVTITRAELRGNRLVISATTSARLDFPRPVLRAYYCCEIAVMKPGDDPSRTYLLEVDIPNPCRLKEVIVLSNRGGTTRTRVTRQPIQA